MNGEKTVFVWDGDEIVMELSGSGKVQKRYIRGNDLVYADKGEDNASGEASEKQYYIKNPHGDVVQLADESGKVIKTYEYDSFGNEVKPDRKDENSFRYCGEYYDKETDTIYLRARYYQPYLGRFLTRDTYTGEDEDPLSLHLYTYCGNDGVNRIDPSGNFWDTLLDIAGLGDSIVSFIKSPSWENAACIVADTVAVAVPGVPGTGIFKAGKYAKKLSGLFNKGRKVVAKFKPAVEAVKTFGKKVGKKVVQKASKVLSKGKDLVKKKLLPKTKNALNKAKNAAKKGWNKAKKVFGNKSPKKPKRNRHIPKAKEIGKKFKTNGAKVQIGVDPNSLTPTKDLRTLDPKRMKNAIKYGGDHVIVVDKNGRVLDGHHRLKYAITQKKAVDVEIP